MEFDAHNRIRFLFASLVILRLAVQVVKMVWLQILFRALSRSRDRGWRGYIDAADISPVCFFGPFLAALYFQQRR